MIQLVDTFHWEQLRPITLTRSIADIRIGIFTIKEKWANYLQQKIHIDTRPYLQCLYDKTNAPDLRINSAVLPDTHLANNILKLENGQSLERNGTWIASKGTEDEKPISYDRALNVLHYPEDIFLIAGDEIKKDLKLVQAQSDNRDISQTNRVVGDPNKIWVSENVTMECCILNVEEGPIYLGKNVKVLEGSMLRGPLSIGDGSVIKMGAKIYQKTSIGPSCKVGGEVNNVVFIGCSNKGHDGYMGNAVIGKWCNWGADTNNSNLKNNYTKVKVWDYESQRFRDTGQQFVGTIMGDHCKTGINTMFNTGTVLGVSCNVFGSGFPRTFIPSFSWGGAHGYKTFQLKKAIETATAMQNRRGKDLSENEINILKYLFEQSSKYRKWERV